MAASSARDPLDGALLGRLRARGRGPAADPALLAADVRLLREAGYLTIAAPAAFGGAALTLPQVACAQRRLAYHAPAAARAVNAHHAWVGAAADAHASGDTSVDWLLTQAAEGRLFAGPASAADRLLGAPPTPAGWDWLGVRAVDHSEPMRPRIVHAFIGRSEPGRLARIMAPGAPDDPFIAGVFGWGLPLDGELCYAIARRAFDIATERARRRAAAGRDKGTRWAGDGRDGTSGGGGRGGPGVQWLLADAAIRLESIRDQLDVVLHGWRERARAGGAVRTLDPGGQWLIRLFTVRHLAVTGARRVAELSAQVDGETSAQADGEITGRIPA
jgi:alkylation response protein AidB-like acyl-CoA dehydrogenase